MPAKTQEAEKVLLASVVRPPLPARPGEVVVWTRLFGSARGLVLCEASKRHAGPLLVVTATAQGVRALEEELRFYADGSELPILPFPDRETLPYDVFSPHPDILSQRLETLYRLPDLERGVVLASAGTLMHRLPPREFVNTTSFLLRTGETLDLDALRRRLADSGYHAVPQVMEPGEFAVRGGLIDLYPLGSPVPYRIDLFGDQVESIREFDPTTQRSGRLHEAVRLLPGREFPLTESGIRQFRQGYRARFEGDPQKSSLYREVSKGLAPAGIEYYLPLFFERTETFFDYLPPSAICVYEEEALAAAEAFRQEAEERYRELRTADRERPVLPPDELFLDASEYRQRLEPFAQVVLTHEEPPQAWRFDTRAPAELPVDPKSDDPYRRLFDYLTTFPGRVLLVAESAGRRETLRALLAERGLTVEEVSGWPAFAQGRTRLALAVADLEKGLLLETPALAVVTEAQLYGERAAQRRRRRAAAERDPAAIIRELAELKVGDPVVHEEHGVGRYLGLKTIDVGDGPSEFIALEYAEGDKLYLPILSLHLISRYTGTDPEHAPLHKLGSESWARAKERARAKAWDAAVELLEVQALRAARPGRAFPIPEAHYHAFADAFPFEETPDQARAIEEVLRDMASPKPMDRLVCGDVGFGKTEVAMRAAFVAVQNGAQVAVLVPTTLLANQHYQNFRDRFAGLPYRIELLSRFRSKGEQAEILAALAEGKVHIVIGTHRLLEDDVRFKDLGLLILDEEHRFGVRQKERLKRLRAEVDILTLTATPIPRTLNMALCGLREISLIATAPQGRLAVKTFVLEWNKAVIREAVLREIRRGGQVYYLHNEVRSIERAARSLQEIVPEAEIRIAHGQMPERELERIMLDFYHQRFNVLVCSTIIESGIDVPTANTIIIERADKLGLAQLHQLRGRVGRSRHRAYAYLLVPGRGAMTEAARKRLEAIASLEELGAGFVLASHDLEIRGAGELLGEAQSGVIDEVGFTLYAELLDRAVKTLRAGGKRPEAERADAHTEVNLHTAALLPQDYVPDVHLRLVLYKRIAGCATVEALQALKEEIIDRFGRLPEAAQHLFQAAELKILASPLGIRRIDAGPRGARIEFAEKPNVDPGAIIRLLQSEPRRYRLEGANRLRLLGEMPEVSERVRALHTLLAKLGATA